MPNTLEEKVFMLHTPILVVGFEKMNNSSKSITSVMLLPPFFKWYPERSGLCFFPVPFYEIHCPIIGTVCLLPLETEVA